MKIIFHGSLDDCRPYGRNENASVRSAARCHRNRTEVVIGDKITSTNRLITPVQYRRGGPPADIELTLNLSTVRPRIVYASAGRERGAMVARAAHL
jgi:hypothetical protein